MLGILFVPAHAGIIYSNFGPDDSFDTRNDWMHSATIGGIDVGVEIAVGFTPDADYELTRFRIGAFHYAGGNDLTVYLTSGALPGAAIETFTTTGIPDTATILSFDSLIHPRLYAGTQYWIVATTSDLLNNDIEWSFTNGESVQINSRHMYHTSWPAWGTPVYTVGPGPVLEVSGSAVPEPATFFTAAIVLLGLLIRSRVRVSRADG